MPQASTIRGDSKTFTSSSRHQDSPRDSKTLHIFVASTVLGEFYNLPCVFPLLPEALVFGRFFARAPDGKLEPEEPEP